MDDGLERFHTVCSIDQKGCCDKEVTMIRLNLILSALLIFAYQNPKS